MAMGDGTHRLPVKTDIREAIGKEACDTLSVLLEERIDKPTRSEQGPFVSKRNQQGEP